MVCGTAMCWYDVVYYILRGASKRGSYYILYYTAYITSYKLIRPVELSTFLEKHSIKLKLRNKKERKKMQKTVIPKLAFSDFEEAYEKKRLIKYDLIWNRAEMTIFS